MEKTAADAAAQAPESGSARQAPFGLLGRRLGHSWSPQIHQELGSWPYELVELEPDEVASFIGEKTWRGLNVTIPYKREAARLADVRSPRVEALGAANTLVRLKDGRVLAENTDVLGFVWMLNRFCRTRLGCSPAKALSQQKVLVLGSGGASEAVQAAFADLDAGIEVVVVSRQGQSNYQNLLELHADAALMVNTTPVGMYPNCPDSPLAQDTLAALPELKGVLDVVYNPTHTGICQAAERLGVPCESGLAMLVAQALFASELFQGKDLDDAQVEKIERQILAQTTNVVLIGMPGAGKTSCGKIVARLLGRPFVDIDAMVEAEEGRSPAEIIREDGEAAFRAVESKVTRRYGARSGIVIACGGGVVTREENYGYLHQNGKIVLIDRPLEELSSHGRPMSQAKGVAQLAAERMGLYRAWADLTLTCTGSAATDAAEVVSRLGLA